MDKDKVTPEELEANQVENVQETATFFSKSNHIQMAFKTHYEKYLAIMKNPEATDEQLRRANIGYNALKAVANDILAPLVVHEERDKKVKSHDIRRALDNRLPKDS